MGSVLAESRICVCAVGGLDPTGGAGIALDSAVIRSLGIHAAIISALDTCQDGNRFFRSTPGETASVVQSLEVLLRVLDIRAIKTGALGTGNNVRGVSQMVGANPGIVAIVDPVARSSTGGELLDEDGVSALRRHLIPVSTLVTPNVPEAALLARTPVSSVGQMANAAKVIVGMGANAVLVKGGHLGGSVCVDVFVNANGDVVELVADRLNVGEIRGTGCALASLIAGYTAQGESLAVSIRRARERLTTAMCAAVRIGTGPRVMVF